MQKAPSTIKRGATYLVVSNENGQFIVAAHENETAHVANVGQMRSA